MSLAPLIDKLIAAGLKPGEAGAIAAEIYAAGVASNTGKSAGAVRQQRWRERLKASQSVTNETQAETSQSVTNRNESVTRDAASLSNKENNKEDSKKKKEVTRGSRLPESWVPSDANREYAIGKGWNSQRVESEGRKFRNYWCAKAGQGATKVNWNLTWENWIDNTIEREVPSNGQRNFNPARRSASADFFAGMSSLAADIVGDDPAPRDADPEVPLGRFNIDG